MNKPKEVPAIYAELLEWGLKYYHRIVTEVPPGKWEGGGRHSPTTDIIKSMDSDIMALKEKYGLPG